MPVCFIELLGLLFFFRHEQSYKLVKPGVIFFGGFFSNFHQGMQVGRIRVPYIRICNRKRGLDT